MTNQSTTERLAGREGIRNAEAAAVTTVHNKVRMATVPAQQSHRRQHPHGRPPSGIHTPIHKHISTTYSFPSQAPPQCRPLRGGTRHPPVCASPLLVRPLQRPRPPGALPPAAARCRPRLPPPLPMSSHQLPPPPLAVVAAASVSPSPATPAARGRRQGAITPVGAVQQWWLARGGRVSPPPPPPPPSSLLPMSERSGEKPPRGRWSSGCAAPQTFPGEAERR